MERVRDKFLFVRFLKEHGVYYQFIDYLNGHSFDGLSSIEYLDSPFKCINDQKIDWSYYSLMINEYLVNSFPWGEYNECHEKPIDWSFLSDEWVSLIKHYRGSRIWR